MATYHSESATAILKHVDPEHDAIQGEMVQFAKEESFPIIGPTVGRFLRIATGMIGASRVIELGSGFGYSATWFLDALPDDGEIVLTELDRDELLRGKEYLDRRGDADRVRFEHGDAVEIVDSQAGPFDVVLIDHEKTRYRDGFDAVKDKVTPGGLVIADNMLHGPASAQEIHQGLVGEPVDDTVAGLVEYLDTVFNTDTFDSTLLPIGSGITVSFKTR